MYTAKESCAFEALFPGLNGIHNILRGRSEQALVLHQRNCRIEHQQDGKDKTDGQYECTAESLQPGCNTHMDLNRAISLVRASSGRTTSSLKTETPQSASEGCQLPTISPSRATML